MPRPQYCFPVQACLSPFIKNKINQQMCWINTPCQAIHHVSLTTSKDKNFYWAHDKEDKTYTQHNYFFITTSTKTNNRKGAYELLSCKVFHSNLIKFTKKCTHQTLKLKERKQYSILCCENWTQHDDKYSATEQYFWPSRKYFKLPDEPFPFH